MGVMSGSKRMGDSVPGAAPLESGLLDVSDQRLGWSIPVATLFLYWGSECSFCRSPCLVGHAGRGLASGGPLTLSSWQLSRVPAPARLSRHSFLTKLPLQVARRLQRAWMAQLGAFLAVLILSFALLALARACSGTPLSA
jgi:hypothetical protein